MSNFGEHYARCTPCRAGFPCDEGEALRAAFVAQRDGYLARMRERRDDCELTPAPVATTGVLRLRR